MNTILGVGVSILIVVAGVATYHYIADKDKPTRAMRVAIPVNRNEMGEPEPLESECC